MNYRGRQRGMKSLVLLGALGAFAIFAPMATASDAHVFDPSLSLNGTGSDPGASHPAKSFNDPCGTTTDAFGDIYVANGATSTAKNEEYEGRIDVYSPSGEFLTEIRN